MITQKSLLAFLSILSMFHYVDNSYAQENQRKFGSLPTISAETDKGEHLSSADLKNKYLVINFFFTSCEGPCPILMEQVRKLAADLKNEDIRFLSFTVDQKTDTLPALKEYRIKRNLLDPRILLLRTSESELHKLLNDDFKLGSGDSPVEHSTRFVLIDKDGKIRSFFSGSYTDLLRSVNEMLE